MYLAFKKTTDDIFDHLTKFFTRSNYVHCELVTVKQADKFFGYSSLPLIGVRSEWVEYKAEDWDFVKVDCFNEITLNGIKKFFNLTEGMRYDYLGACGIVLKRLPQDPVRYFCSEWCAKALGISKAWTYSPAKLREYVIKYSKGEI